MLGYLKDLLQENKKSINSQNKPFENEKHIQIATCALFLEIANSDDEFTNEERKKIYSIMKNTFDLSSESVLELIKLSEEQVEKSVSLYEFTEIINKNFSENMKYEVLKNLWRLIFVDKKIEAYEEYFIRKISTNMHLPHKDLIAAKTEVKKELNI
ncbi:MAG: hypothetical protein A2V66_14025 [Ignavibacteria bacterium RBG_13_36_8]|nr:MAG: hypothetical protein A2V66_14025 [Ignavibacteria bacterium RBG_13_36_8]